MNDPMPPLTLTPLPGIPLIHQGDDLAALIGAALSRAGIAIRSGDVLVLAQKIVSKAEGRVVHLRDVTPSPQAHALAAETEKDPRLVELILRESDHVVRARPGLIVVQHRRGFVCANAGIDHSNVAEADDAFLLLPENPDASAQRLRTQLASGIDLGVLIIDSHGRAWRNGTVGVAIGLAGLPGLVDLRGEADLFGYELQATEVAAADELAAAASLMMGQAAEGFPVIHARGFPYPLRPAALPELLRPAEKDLFR
jgi:coenzyme F420-0:L-glutamate ligase/coenzyme F420-1:gamma-L-glutamate ligase